MTPVLIDGRPVDLRLTPAARRALAMRRTPLVAELELYFSCLIRKRVRFVEGAAGTGVEAAPNLRVCFRPIMTRSCGKDFEGDEPPVTDFPIERAEAFVPQWLAIDYRAGQWHGDFGYENAQRKEER